MRLHLIACMLLLILTAGCVNQKRHFGTYFNKWRYQGATYILNPDSSFSYDAWYNAGAVTVVKPGTDGGVGHTILNYPFADTSYGRYHIINDTVFLNYATEEMKGDFSEYNIRPKKLFWRGKSLYYINLPTGEVINGKEEYMRWSRRKTFSRDLFQPQSTL